MAESIKTQGIPHKKLRPIIERVRRRLKKHPIVREMFKKHKIDIDEIDLIPMCFADIDVSARTDHGVIYFGLKLLKDGDFDKDDHYLVHELTHFCQQTTGDEPTPGSDEGEYLDNPAEKEGFQNQSEYLAETRGDMAAERYINQVLDHHKVKGKKRDKRLKELLEMSGEPSIPKVAMDSEYSTLLKRLEKEGYGELNIPSVSEVREFVGKIAPWIVYRHLYKCLSLRQCGSVSGYFGAQANLNGIPTMEISTTGHVVNAIPTEDGFLVVDLSEAQFDYPRWARAKDLDPEDPDSLAEYFEDHIVKNPFSTVKMYLSKIPDEAIDYMNVPSLELATGRAVENLVPNLQMRTDKMLSDRPDWGSESDPSVMEQEHRSRDLQQIFPRSAAEKYINQVLGHHKVKGKKRERRLKELLDLSEKTASTRLMELEKLGRWVSDPTGRVRGELSCEDIQGMVSDKQVRFALKAYFHNFLRTGIAKPGDIVSRRVPVYMRTGQLSFRPVTFGYYPDVKAAGFCTRTGHAVVNVDPFLIEKLAHVNRASLYQFPNEIYDSVERMMRVMDDNFISTIHHELIHSSDVGVEGSESPARSSGSSILGDELETMFEMARRNAPEHEREQEYRELEKYIREEMDKGLRAGEGIDALELALKELRRHKQDIVYGSADDVARVQDSLSAVYWNSKKEVRAYLSEMAGSLSRHMFGIARVVLDNYYVSDGTPRIDFQTLLDDVVSGALLYYANKDTMTRISGVVLEVLRRNSGRLIDTMKSLVTRYSYDKDITDSVLDLPEETDLSSLLTTNIADKNRRTPESPKPRFPEGLSRRFVEERGPGAWVTVPKEIFFSDEEEGQEEHEEEDELGAA